VSVLAALEPQGLDLSTGSRGVVADQGVVTDTAAGPADAEFARAFVASIAAHRHWDRPPVRR
jgi:catalase